MGPALGPRCLGKPVAAWLTCSLPTGTGKTVVGFHIVFWFYKLNEEPVLACGTPCREKQLGPPCILYCGPSNKSVDVVAGALGQPWGLCWGRRAQGTAAHAQTAPRNAPEQKGRAEAPPCVQRAGGGHRVPSAGREQPGPAQEDPSGGEAQSEPQVPPLSVCLAVCLSVCLWVEGRGPSCLRVLPWAVGNTGFMGSPRQGHHAAPPDPAVLQPLRALHQGF